MATRAAAVTLALAVAACGTDARSQNSLPDGAVAVVGDTTIGADDLARATAALRRARSAAQGAGEQEQGDPDEPTSDRRLLREQALAQLLHQAAVEQEAAERRIRVTLADARRRWRAVAQDQFLDQRALSAFLGGQTEADVVRQLRIQLLSARIDADVAKQAGGRELGYKAIRWFRNEFRRRWREETTCREDFTVPGC